MSIFNDKTLKGVAEAAAKIMDEQLKGNQHKIDANKNGRVDAQDFKILRAKKTIKEDDTGYQDRYAVKNGKAVKHNPMRGERDEPHHVWADSAEHAVRKHAAKTNAPMKEDVEQLDEVGDTPAGRKALSSYVMKALNDKNRQKGLRKATSRLYKDNYYGKKTNEEVEQLQEYESKDGVFKHKAKLEKGVQYGETDWDKEEKEAKKMSSPKRAQKSYGARQNYVRGTSTGEKKKVNEELSFTEMLELYNEHGLKVLAPIETEEMDIDGTTIEVIDADKVNGFVETTIEEGLDDAVKGAVGVVKNVINKEKAYQSEKQKKAGEVLSKMRREEVTNDQFTKEFEDQKASFEGKKPQPKVAAGKTTGVKAMPEEVELDEEYEYISEAEYLELSEEEQQFWEAVTSQSYSNLRDKKSKVPATEFGAKGTKTKVLDQIRSHESRKTHSTGKNVYATDYKVGKKDTAEMLYRKKSGKRGQVPSQRAGLRRDRYHEEVEHLDERTLTKGEAEKKEEYVKGMKKKLSGFKQRYGERAKEVMYATATKMAKKD